MPSIIKDFNYKSVTAGVLSAVMGLASTPVLILEAASKNNFTTSQTISWMFSVYVIGGLLSIFLPLRYRIPITGANSITAVAFLTAIGTQFTYNELIGSYVLAGLLLLLIGWSGVFSKMIEFIPREVMSAMLAGMIIKYMINFILSINELLLVGIISLMVFLVFSKLKNRISPVVAAIVAGTAVMFLTQPMDFNSVEGLYILPCIKIPNFSFSGFLSVSVPLALLLLSNDIAIGLGALEQSDFNPPVKQIIIYSGIFSILAGFFGGQSANIAGMMTAITAGEEAGPKDKRYTASIASGIILIIFGLFSWKLVPFIQILPKNFISILVGFALIGVFGNSLHISFSNSKLKLSVIFPFIISMANITFFNISAAVWSLAIGTLIACYVEGYRIVKY